MSKSDGGTTQTDDGIGEGGEGLRGRADADAAGILTEGDIADGMDAVFNDPVGAPERFEVGGAGQVARQVGEAIADFLGGGASRAPGAPGPAAYDLLQPRPGEIVIEGGGGFQGANLKATVGFVQGALAFVLLALVGSLSGGC